MKTSKYVLLAFILLLISSSCKKGSDQTDVNTLSGSWYELIALKPQGEFEKEYTFHTNNTYSFKITSKRMSSSTNSNEVTGEVVETGKYIDNQGTLRFYKNRITSWETGFPSSDITYNDGILSNELKYRFINGKLELEYRGPGPADEPSVYITTYTRRVN